MLFGIMDGLGVTLVGPNGQLTDTEREMMRPALARYMARGGKAAERIAAAMELSALAIGTTTYSARLYGLWRVKTRTATGPGATVGAPTTEFRPDSQSVGTLLNDEVVVNGAVDDAILGSMEVIG